jgi:hypothetical protein
MDVKLAGSISDPRNAIRNKSELPANANIATAVSRSDFLLGVQIFVPICMLGALLETIAARLSRRQTHAG